MENKQKGRTIAGYRCDRLGFVVLLVLTCNECPSFQQVRCDKFRKEAERKLLVDPQTWAIEGSGGYSKPKLEEVAHGISLLGLKGSQLPHS